MYTFKKDERLCSKKLIEDVFLHGERLMAFPFSVRWRIIPEAEAPFEARAQVLISTSKRKFHHAVDRNRVKRLMRECYRLQKPQLYEFLEQNHCQLVLAINYIHTEIFTFEVLQRKYDKMLAALMNDINKRDAE